MLSGSAPHVSLSGYSTLGQVELLDNGPPGGGFTSYTYYSAQEANSRLERIQAVGGETLLDLSYTYDQVDNVASIADAADLGAEQVFAYDELDRLVGVSGVYDRAYAYDQVGNIVDSNGRAYLYEGSGHPHVQPHAVTQAGGESYTYDANGNMQTGPTEGAGTGAGRALTWDTENRLVEASQDGQVTAFTYDGDGVLVRKEVDAQPTVYIGPHYEMDAGAGSGWRSRRAARSATCTPITRGSIRVSGGKPRVATDNARSSVLPTALRTPPSGPEPPSPGVRPQTPVRLWLYRKTLRLPAGQAAQKCRNISVSVLV